MNRRRQVADQAIKSYSPTLFRLFVRYLTYYFARNFTAIRALKPGFPELPADRPVILYSNHIGWWDPILYLLLSSIVTPGRKGFGPIDESALGKYGFLRRLGLFPIAQSRVRGAAQFLTAARLILGENGHALWLTPQGRFGDARERPIVFKAGLAHLAQELPDAVIVPFAIEYPFWGERKPEVLIAFAMPINAHDHKGKSVKEWTELLQDRLAAAMDTLAAAAIAREAVHFDILITGKPGVSLVYDGWRRLKALVKGEDFSAAHGGK